LRLLEKTGLVWRLQEMADNILDDSPDQIQRRRKELTEAQSNHSLLSAEVSTLLPLHRLGCDALLGPRLAQRLDELLLNNLGDKHTIRNELLKLHKEAQQFQNELSSLEGHLERVDVPAQRISLEPGRALVMVGFGSVDGRRLSDLASAIQRWDALLTRVAALVLQKPTPPTVAATELGRLRLSIAADGKAIAALWQLAESSLRALEAAAKMYGVVVGAKQNGFKGETLEALEGEVRSTHGNTLSERLSAWADRKGEAEQLASQLDQHILRGGAIAFEDPNGCLNEASRVEALSFEARLQKRLAQTTACRTLLLHDPAPRVSQVQPAPVPAPPRRQPILKRSDQH
jgi:hypothetical protein